MLRVLLLLLLLGMPCTASAQEYDLQAEDVLLSELMQVKAIAAQSSRQQRAAGQVRDVLFDRQGDMISLLVDRNPVVESSVDDARRAPPVRRSSGAYEELYEFDLADVRYDAASSRLFVAEEESRRHAARHVKLLPSGQVHASELLELPVNLVEARTGRCCA